ncbi:hypothetical protein Gorai_009253 [Gossypium raimondii]|uniref:Uncharacterized protein n=1 Tax=Gossypium raimondii TaxID=29730 RepID=A0A7J8PSJ8_GOSRA|nr:hypothetical protein [Gossypium raimondii]
MHLDLSHLLSSFRTGLVGRTGWIENQPVYWFEQREKMKMKSYAVFLSRQTIYTLVISSW